MSTLSQSQVKRLTAIHGWSGTVLGLLLYAVVISGTVVVFEDEISSWSIGGTRGTGSLSTDLDAKVRPLAEATTKGYREAIGVWMDTRGDLLVFPHAHVKHPPTGEMSDFGPLYRLDSATGELLDRNEGFVWYKPEWTEASALRKFLVELHVQLYVPEPWGLILTGILGLAMMGAGVTGLLMHRHLIRDLFVAERPGQRLVSARDRHVLAASWGLPFAFLLGFTGAYFSFAGTVGFPILVQIAFGGDERAMADILYEPPVETDARPADSANLDDVVARSTAHAGSRPEYVEIARYGRADSRISVWHDAPEGSLNAVHNLFDGASGAFLGARPAIGNQPSTAAAVSSLMGPLHFGNFAGVLSKSVWVGLGTAMCFVILTGMRLWIRRREEEKTWRRFGRAVTVVAYGLPLAMLGSAYAFFLSLPAGDPFWWTPAGFLIVALACIGYGVAAKDARLTLAFQRSLSAGCLALPVLRMVSGGTSWAEALVHGQGAVLSIDLLLIAVGALLPWMGRDRAGERRRPRQATAEPAA